MDYARPRTADALAAQYVAGTLRGRARRRFEALLPAHPQLRAAVQRWQANLLPLAGPLPPVTPPPRVWQAIAQRLWPQPAPLPWWQKLGLWRGATALAGVAALALALQVARVPPDAAPPIVVVLQGTGDGGSAAGSSLFVASLAGDGGSLVTRPLQTVALPVLDAQRVLELWAVPPQGAPRSLGLVSASGVSVVPRARLRAAQLEAGRTQALAVSVEPAGGSPTGAPTGPVVFAGKLTL